MTSCSRLAIAILTAPTVAAAQTAPAMFRGGPEHKGVYASATTPTLRTPLWKFKTDGKVLSSPALAGGAVIFGSTDHHLYSVNAVTGTLNWKFVTQGAVNSSPAVAGGVVYVNSLDGTFYAVDAATGTERWKFATKGERRFTAPGVHGIMPRTEIMPDPFDMFLSSPVVANGVVYFGSGDFNVYALDAATGALKWKFATGNVVHATPAVANGVVYIGSWDRNLYALDATTGKERWHFQTGQDTVIYNQVGIASSAAVANGVVYVGCRDGFLYAVNANTGSLRWKHDNNHGWVIASPAVSNGAVLFPTSDGTRFKSLDAMTGALRFNIANNAISFSSPAIVNTTVFYGSSDGWLHAVDTKTGKVVGEFQSDGSKQNAKLYIDASGHFIGKAIYPDRTLDGITVGIDRMFSLGSIISSPIVGNGTLYVGSTDGNVYALR